MAPVTAALVKQLRDQTGAGMMDCKAALTESDGDFEAAVDWLRKKGLAAAAKKAGRVAAQGLVGVEVSGRRGAAVEVDQGVVGSYVHGAFAPGLGTIGVLVGLHSSGDPDRLAALGKQLAMHVAAARPQAVGIDRLDPATLARERAIYADQARASGKPDNIIDKIVEGRVRRFYEEAVLLEQPFVIEPDLKVKDAIDRVAEEIGSSIAVTEFVRFALGEGVSGPSSELAEEVAQLAGS